MYIVYYYVYNTEYQSPNVINWLLNYNNYLEELQFSFYHIYTVPISGSLCLDASGRATLKEVNAKWMSLNVVEWKDIIIVR